MENDYFAVQFGDTGTAETFKEITKNVVWLACYQRGLNNKTKLEVANLHIKIKNKTNIKKKCHFITFILAEITIVLKGAICKNVHALIVY